MSGFYRLIDHTADVGIRVTGEDLPALHRNAARAMFDLITDLARLTARERVALTVTGSDRADLMVNWLRELLYLWNGRQLLVADVAIDSLTEDALSARAMVAPFDNRCHTILREIKAVTYHRIRVAATPDGWETIVILDT